MPLYRLESVEGGGVMGLWRIDESEQDLLSMLAHLPNIQGELERLTAQSRRIEFLATRCLLKVMSDENLTVSYMPSGRPYISGSELNISISHTKGMAAVMLHPTKRVAIDIERNSPKAHRLRERFLSKLELTVDSEEYSLICWSAKETLFKLIDQQEVDFIDHLHITPFNPEPVGSFIATQSRIDYPQPFTIHYEINPDWALTWSAHELPL